MYKKNIRFSFIYPVFSDADTVSAHMTWNDVSIEILMWNLIGSYPALVQVS